MKLHKTIKYILLFCFAYTNAQSLTFTVTYNANNCGSTTVPTDVTNYSAGAIVTVKAAATTSSGCTFLQWNTKADGTGTNYVANSGTFSINANTTLYAIWTSCPIYAIAYAANGGSGSMTGGSYTACANIVVQSNTFTRTNCAFVNFNTAADGSGTIYNAGGFLKVVANTTMYAIWNCVPVTGTCSGGEH